MKKILVPCNFSTCCHHGLTLAAALSKKTDAEIIVLTVINQEYTSAVLPAITTESASSRFKNMVSRLPRKTLITHLIKNGNFLPAVLECIDEQNIDLIVMGTKGSRGWDQFFLGSNIEKVTRVSPIPVLALKENLTLHRIKNIVFPLELKHDYNNLIPKLKCIQNLFHARIHMLHVCKNEKTNQHELKDHIQQFALKSGLQNYTVNIWTDPDPKDGIISFSNQIGADLIVLQSHPTINKKNLYRYSVVADLVNHSHVPIWTFPIE